MFVAAFWMAEAGWDFVRAYRTRILGEDARVVLRSRWWFVSLDSVTAKWRDPRIVWSPSADEEVERARQRLLRRYYIALLVTVSAMSIPFILGAITGTV
jgi:hypothetical protein